MDSTEIINNNNYKDEIIHVSGMYKNWFLDYASYVILERAVPNINDGLKPVQRRILHSLKEMEDGRYHKVANVIGHTMKYHPHGDASIGDALVQIGQKELLLDMQGNWGNTATGDKAAAARYIEVRLTKFALEVLYNNKITKWSLSYDGRSKEPETLPVKFPLLLAHGVEGIAVGLSTKILPHNFNELIDASIKVLKGIKPRIYPDFITGGTADFTNYMDGKRGGKIRVRAKITQYDKTTLLIKELPYSTTSTSLINSILKANEKGKIKIKKVEDNTSDNVEICITIPTGISPDKTIDALYRFTDCEISISPLSCIIENESPSFIGVSEILQRSTNQTLSILKKELNVILEDLNNKWHSLSLENIFIQKRIYHEIEELDDWELILSTIKKKIQPYIKGLKQEVTLDDITKLTEIKIKKITRFDINKAQEELINLESKITITKNHLNNIIEYAISYFKELKKKYGKGKERKTEIKVFENIDATKVVVASKKLYVNREEGFIGSAMRKEEFISDCSDIDDIIIFRRNGTMKVVKIDNKIFVGKDIIHCSIFKKKDERTTYNMIYKDGKTSKTFMKRFCVKSITRGKEYNLTKSEKGSKVLYLTANPNGEAEIVTINLRKLQKLRIIKFDINFADIDIKNKNTKGNIVTKNPVKNIELKTLGVSTLSARKIWFDDNVNRLNTEERGEYLGAFKGEDKILTINQKGDVELKSYDISNHFSDDIIIIEKLNNKKPVSIIYFDGSKKCFYIKRFLINNLPSKFNTITDHKNSYLELVSTDWLPRVELIFIKEKGKERKTKIINIAEFINIKGYKANGNKLSSKNIKNINLLDSIEYKEDNVSDKSIDKNIPNIKLNINNTNSEDQQDGQISLEL